MDCGLLENIFLLYIDGSKYDKKYGILMFDFLFHEMWVSLYQKVTFFLLIVTIQSELCNFVI